MTKALRWMVAVAVMTLVVPAVASAENFYGAVRGGPVITPDTRGGIAGAEDVVEFKTGFAGSGAVGYAFPFGLRAEGEIGFVYARLKRDGGVEVEGSITSYLLMANAYYDVKIPALGPFKPYVGFGIGAARVNDDHEVAARSGCAVCLSALPAKIELDEWRTAFAYQARGGMIYDVNQWLDLSLGYRYVHIDGGHQDLARLRINLGATNNHAIELGFAVKF